MQFDDRYAILISGGIDQRWNFPRYLNDLKLTYATLVEKLNFSKVNIDVFYAGGDKVDLDADGQSELLKPALQNDIIKEMKKLENLISMGDLLIFVTTNHGSYKDFYYNSYLDLWNYECLYAAELGELLENINSKLQIFVLGQCYSGGFIPHLRADNRVIITASQKDEKSWKCGEGNSVLNADYDEFLYHFWSSIRGMTPAGKPIRLETGGQTNLKNIFNYARSSDLTPATPQLNETPQGLANLFII